MELDGLDFLEEVYIGKISLVTDYFLVREMDIQKQ